LTELVPGVSASAIPEGGLAAFTVAGKPVAIARVGGVLYAFDDTCTHRGCSLADGDLDGRVVTCPCHAGELDVTTGAVLGGPPPEPVSTYPVRVEGDAIAIDL
jgi:nitrite reductase/ring-hydroxylating ferredoxin subunit